jgi:hypothetical protein
MSCHDCLCTYDDDNSYVVGESEADSPKPGSRILHTADGGKTWEVQLYNPNPAYSLMAIEMISETEVCTIPFTHCVVIIVDAVTNSECVCALVVVYR